MTSQSAKGIFDKIDASSLAELKADLYQAAEKYTCYRLAWRRAEADIRHSIDPARTRSHNALIDAFNILSREQSKCGEDNSWRGVLGDDRKEIGDMAAYLVLFMALSAR